MDHGDQCEREGLVMSQSQGGGVYLCHNLPDPDLLMAENQSLNLNQTRTLSPTHTHSQPSPLDHSLLENEGRGGCELIRQDSFNNNEEEEEEERREGLGRQQGEEDEEEENDEVMKEESESEESSLIRCQSPDTPMTDSSYSETGSLLETPYPISPGTSPEPTSPTVPVTSPETTYPIRPEELNRCEPEVSSHISDTGSITCTAGPSTSITGPTYTAGPTCITGPIDSSTGLITCTTQDTVSVTRAIDSTSLPTSTTGPVSSATESITSTQGASHLRTTATCTTGPSGTAGPQNSTTETGTSITGSTSIAGLNSITCPTVSAPAPTCTTGPVSTTTTEPITSVSGHTGTEGTVTSATGPVPCQALLASLQQLGQRGEDTHLPQYLHQIAEAFVLQEDYQRALWCIQLERLYHQRILQNLATLQEHWESRSRTSVSDLDTQQLDTLTHICQTHQQPGARDTQCASLDSLLRPSTFEEERLCAPSSSCTPGCMADSGMDNEQTETADSSLSRDSQPIASSAPLTDSSCSTDGTGGDRPATGRGLKRRGGFYGNQPTDREESSSFPAGEGGAEQTTTRNPPAQGEVSRPEPAEPQGGETEREEVEEEEEEEEREVVEEAEEALDMEEEEEGEEEEGEEEEKEEREPSVCLKALPEEALVMEEGVVRHLHQEAHLHQEVLADEELHHNAQVSEEAPPHQEARLHQEANLRQEADLCQEAYLHQEARLHQEAHMKQQEQYFEEEEFGVERVDIIREAATLDDLAKRITVEEISPASGLVSILKRRSVCVDDVCPSSSTEPRHTKPPAERRVRFKVPDEGFDHDVGGRDSCLLLFLLCMVTVVISVGGTALYCALGDAHSSVCQDFSRNANFYVAQMQRGIAQLQHWFAPGS